MFVLIALLRFKYPGSRFSAKKNRHSQNSTPAFHTYRVNIVVEIKPEIWTNGAGSNDAAVRTRRPASKSLRRFISKTVCETGMYTNGIFLKCAAGFGQVQIENNSATPLSWRLFEAAHFDQIFHKIRGQMFGQTSAVMSRH